MGKDLFRLYQNRIDSKTTGEYISLNAKKRQAPFNLPLQINSLSPVSLKKNFNHFIVLAMPVPV